jgi:predicted DCC family thiol-disulfide oxidoreductase YuxK
VTIVYDGLCHLCSTSIAWIVQRVDDGMRFVPAQSAEGADALLLRLLPRAAADRIYCWVAANRYKWFGRPTTFYSTAVNLASTLSLRRSTWAAAAQFHR